MPIKIEIENCESASADGQKVFEAEILSLEKSIVNMAKRPAFYAREIANAKIRIRSLKRNILKENVVNAHA